MVRDHEVEGSNPFSPIAADRVDAAGEFMRVLRGLMRNDISSCTSLLTGLVVIALGTSCVMPVRGAAATPKPAADLPAAGDGEKTRTAVFAMGCFWCSEAVFEQLNGVIEVTAGYA